MLYAFVHQSGLLGQLATRETLESEEQVRNLSKLFSITQRIGGLLEHDRVESFIRYLDLLIEVGTSICPGEFPHAASSALGLEAAPFPYKMTTICFVGPSAYAPVHSAVTLFREEFEVKIVKRKSIPVTAGFATVAHA